MAKKKRKVDEVIKYGKDTRKTPEELSDIAKKTDKTVQGYDSEGNPIEVTPNDDLSEEQIEEMVRESQNPVMSKQELINEMRSMLLKEDNPYEDELESGENPYSKHLDKDTVRDLGRRIYSDISRAAEEKFGNANFGAATRAMSQSLMNILQYEMDKKPQLQEEAIRLIREKHPGLTEDVVDIEATITGHPQMGGRQVRRQDLRFEKGNTPPPSGYSPEELKAEVTKRRLINGMSHGSARKAQNLHHLADESRVPSNMKSEYAKLMAANDFIYWAMDREMIRQQGRSGEHAGNVKVLLPNENDGEKPKIVAEGMTFSILLHELEKGVKELISLHGTHEDMEMQRYVYDQVDHLDAEQDDIRMGVGIWEKVSQYIDIENPEHEALLYQKIVSLPAQEMNSLIGGLLKDDQNSINVIEELADEASRELSEEEYEDAISQYDDEDYGYEDEDGEFADGEPGEDDGEYSDPLLKDLLSGSNDDEPRGYEDMSQPELERLMDDALDNGDFEKAREIGKYLN